MGNQAKPPGRRKVGRPGGGEDVRAGILAAALRQLETSGNPDRVTVAAIVDEAGCTPPSLYHYWPKRELLLQEAGALAWAVFRASQTGAVADHDDPVGRLRLRGQAYLEFALAKPALFRVLFLEPQLASSAEQPADPGDALNGLISDVSAAITAGAIRPADPLTTALALWSAVHGIAALWTVTPNLPVDLAHAVCDLAQDALLAGLAV